MLKGAIDIVSRDRISGWAHLCEDPGQRLVVTYTAESGEVFSAVADIYRPDLEAAGFGDGACGFNIVLPEGRRIPASVLRIEVNVPAAGEKLVHERSAEAPGSFSIGGARSVAGDIEVVENGVIRGWLASPRGENMLPVVTVDGRPVAWVDYPVPRPDVSEVIGVSGDFGFIAHAGAMAADARVDLHAVLGRGSVHITSRRAPAPKVETVFLRQLERARDIARQPGAVAVTCWDACHNPMARAKVLYDVARLRRPALIAAYMFKDFGGAVWPPIKSTDTELLTIPWADRAVYHAAMRDVGLSFDTVWICKPRFPGIEMAAHLASPDARILLDFDDNEEQFMLSPGGQSKPYGWVTANHVRSLVAAIPARTAASGTLMREMKAEIVRHARAPVARRPGGCGDDAPVARPAGSSVIDRVLRRNEATAAPTGTAPVKRGPAIGFIGTVRPHKHLLEAARAVQIFNWSTGMDAVLHVYGEVRPESHVAELAAQNVVIKTAIPMSELNSHLSRMDVVLTGFPGLGEEDDAINRYQISSKIGDALAMGMPALVPLAPGVEDLADVPGVFLFDELSFGDALRAALEYREQIVLPEAFTLEGAYKSFAAAEAKAETAPRAAEVLGALNPALVRNAPRPLQPTLLLVWKQSDTQVFGRRVDQIARSYRRAHPDHRVVVVELVPEVSLKATRSKAEEFVSDQRLILAQTPGKIAGTRDADGVEVRQIVFDSSDRLAATFERFLLSERILPQNSVVVLFPIIRVFERIARIVEAYVTAMDVVDNQYAWASTAERRMMTTAQYHSMARSVDRIIFNSVRNRDLFAAQGLLPDTAMHRILPNWYSFPAGYDAPVDRRRTGGPVNIIYSGNLTARIDWSLIQRTAGLSDDVVVHLVGMANVADAAFMATIDLPNVIYHGPMGETETLYMLETMDIAIMPHKVDGMSAYMNPLKVQMYAAVGLPTIVTDVPGVSAGATVTVAATPHDFVEAVRSMIAAPVPRRPQAEAGQGAAAYLEEIAALWQVVAARQG